jgi:hypothetical protein
VARKIVNICVLFALLTGCWGGVIAAAACPHAGCETAATLSEVAVTTHCDHTGGHDAVNHGEHSEHISAHAGHAAESANRDQRLLNSGGLQIVVPKQHDRFCTHCIGSPEAPPSPSFEWQSNSARKSGGFAAPPAAVQVESSAPVFLQKITPAQHAPPGTSDRHLLLNVFRI